MTTETAFLAGFTVASAGLILLGFALDYAHRVTRRRMADGFNALLDEANERGRQRERKLAAQVYSHATQIERLEDDLRWFRICDAEPTTGAVVLDFRGGRRSK